MISDTRVRTLARWDGVTAGLAEKHYVNSWVLYAIYRSPLGDSVVFKGGTALSKLYFPEIWRFSEDLDFTATEQLPDVEVKLDLVNGLPADDVEAVRTYWEQALKRLVTEQLAFDTVVERIDDYLLQLATVDR